MQIVIGDIVEIQNIKMPGEPDGDEISSLAIPYQVDGLTGENHTHMISLDVLAELELLYGMPAEEAIEYAIMMRVHTLTLGFEPEEDWERYYESPVGLAEIAMREAGVEEAFRESTNAQAAALAGSEDVEKAVRQVEKACLSCAERRNGPDQVSKALNTLSTCQNSAKAKVWSLLTEHSIDKECRGWNRLRTVCMNSSKRFDEARHRVFDAFSRPYLDNQIRNLDE